MRTVLLANLLLAACSAQPNAPPGPPPGTYQGAGAGAGRDRLIVAGTADGLTADLLVFAPDGTANCSMAGKLSRAGPAWQLTPHGEEECRVTLAIDGKLARVTNVPAACSYYCGPGASLDGKQFTLGQ